MNKLLKGISRSFLIGIRNGKISPYASDGIIITEWLQNNRMLNDTTKRKINSLRQILVGKVPDPKSQVDQITNALIYKYMDDMDKQNKTFGKKQRFFAGEYEKYSWKHLMNPKLGGQDRFDLYVEALEKLSDNPNFSPIFRDILKGASLPYRSPETLTLFLNEIDTFTYDHSEELGNAFEYLLSIMDAQGDAGQFRTPRHIIDFIVKAVDPEKGKKILDPACGTAGFLISAYKHILENNKNVIPGDILEEDELQQLHRNFSGFEISPDMTKLSRVNMFLHSFDNPKIYEYDTLSDDSRWEETYDVILANPPFMTPRGGIIPHNRFGISANRAEVLFVDYIVDHLNFNGRAGVIVPEGIIFQSANAYKKLRKKIVEKGLFCVVSLPSGVFNPYAGVKTSVLFFDKEIAKKSKDILFVKVENDGFNLGAQRRPIEKNDLPLALDVIQEFREHTMRGEGSIFFGNRLSKWVEKKKILASETCSLSAGNYQEESVLSKSEWPIVTLEEVCEINPKKKELDILSDTEVSFVPMADISESEMFFEAKQRKAFGDVSTGYTYFRDNDVLLAKVTPCFENGKSGIARNLYNGIGFGSSEFIVLRASKKVLSEYIYYFISSDAFKAAGKERMLGTGGLQRISMDFVKEYKIPLPPIEVQKQIVAELDGYRNIISGARLIVENWKPKFDIDPAWEKKTIDDVCDIFGGGTPSRSVKKYWGGDIPWISARYFADDHTINGSEMITDEGLEKSSSKIAPKGSTILITRVSVGKFAIADRDYAINQDLTALVPKDGSLNEKYLWLISEIVAEKIKNSATGVGVTGVTRDFVMQQEIPFPSRNIQDQIVERIEAERALVESGKKLIGIYEQKTKDTMASLWNK